MNDEEVASAYNSGRSDAQNLGDEGLGPIPQNEDHVVSDLEPGFSEAPDREIPSDIPDFRRIHEELCQLRVLFSQRISYDGTKEKAFERLYQELAELKRNVAFENSRPLFLDLILLYDRMESLQEDTTISPAARRSLRSLTDELREVLSRQEINAVETTHAVFDPEQQQAVGAEQVDDPRESGKVVRVVRRGFCYRGRLLRAEEVIVARYAKKNGDSGVTLDRHDSEKEKTEED